MFIVPIWNGTQSYICDERESQETQFDISCEYARKMQLAISFSTIILRHTNPDRFGAECLQELRHPNMPICSHTLYNGDEWQLQLSARDELKAEPNIMQGCVCVCVCGGGGGGGDSSFHIWIIYLMMKRCLATYWSVVLPLGCLVSLWQQNINCTGGECHQPPSVSHRSSAPTSLHSTTHQPTPLPQISGLESGGSMPLQPQPHPTSENTHTLTLTHPLTIEVRHPLSYREKDKHTSRQTDSPKAADRQMGRQTEGRKGWQRRKQRQYPSGIRGRMM